MQLLLSFELNRARLTILSWNLHYIAALLVAVIHSKCQFAVNFQQPKYDGQSYIGCRSVNNVDTSESFLNENKFSLMC